MPHDIASPPFSSEDYPMSAEPKPPQLRPPDLVVCLAQFMVILDISIVNVALPAIHDALGFSHDRPAVGRQRLHARPSPAS